MQVQASAFECKGSGASASECTGVQEVGAG